MGRPFYFVRHGESDWNRLGLCVGQVDRKLTGGGRRQAQEACEAISRLGITHVAHSPLSRAAETAQILSEKIVCKMWADVDLREACLGVKEGLPEDDPCDDFISRWLAGDHIPRAESFHEVEARVGAALEKCLSVTGEGILLIVSHWGVFAALSSRLGVAFQEPEHCLPYGFTRSGSGWQVRRCG